MIVRRADPDADALAIFDGARDFVARMDCRDIVPIDDAALLDALSQIVASANVEIWLAEQDGKVVGGIGLLFSPFLWNRNVETMSELFIWAAKDAPVSAFLRLNRMAQRRKAERGAGLTEFHRLTSSPDGIARVYAGMGLRKVQETWMG